MRLLRSLAASALLFLAGLGFTVLTPGQADAQYYYRSYGTYNYPYYWSNYNAYRAYNPYTGYNRYGVWQNYRTGYNPYYSWYRSYPWGWY